MFAFFFFFILIVNANDVLGCGMFETRKRCECKATYAVGNVQSSSLLFTLPSYDDCGINLGCGKERERESAWINVKVRLDVFLF